MDKRKICVVITARPSYSRIRSALIAINDHPGLELQVVVAASALLDRFGSAVHFIEADGIHIDAQVYMVMEGESLTSMAKTTGIGIMELSTAFDNLKPDIVLTVADRYETIATAIAASYMNIPVVHVQGGEITGSIDEKVRHAVTKLSDYHFVASTKAMERVIKLGENPDRVFVTGCPSIDIAAEVIHRSDLTFNPFTKYGGVGNKFKYDDGYLVVMQHPVTNEYELATQHVTETLKAVNLLGYPTFWFWPNVDAGSDGTSNAIRTFREEEDVQFIHFFKNMSPEDFLLLLNNSRGIVGNSSVAIRECSYLGVPAVNIGTRQSGREQGTNVKDVDYNCEQISETIQVNWKNGKHKSTTLYGDGKAGEKISELLMEIAPTTEKRLTY